VRVDRALDHGFTVADDGVGIAENEIELALERHATSKLAAFEDLDALTTLGFRGEALPSIAAVSQMRVISRRAGADAAAVVGVAGGVAHERGAAARAPGTTVEVRDLFYNVPARRKFLSTPAGELRAAIRMLEAYALGFPGVAFRLTVDERERFHWAPATSRLERAAQLWGARHADQLLEAEGDRDGIEVWGLLGLPEHARATRDGQVFLINRRWVQSPLLGQALRQAYGNLLPAGRFPSAVLWLSVPPSRLDVNVHPTKREVRFVEEDRIFGLVAGVASRPLTGLQPPFTVVRGGTPEPAWADRVRERPADPAQLGLGLVGGRAPAASAPAGAAEAAAPAAAPGVAADSEPELWQLHRTYVMAPVRGGLVIVDQHAAHERILFEEALARMAGERGASQQLLFPHLVDLSRAQFELMLEAGPSLHQLGWDVAPLGAPTVVIQGVPSGLKHERPGQLLQDILDGVGEDSARSSTQEMSERIARSWACHAATRAGDPLSREEMRSLVDRLFATSQPHGDPHGRVTFVRLDLDELHRRFGRT
jgi:DNA mismatch repair protein MutL